MRKTTFGKLNDEEIYSYTFGKGRIKASVLNLGGILHKLTVDGTDIIYSYKTLDDVLSSSGYHGAIIGRYANRIEGGKFSLGGKEYTLFKNEAARDNCLHGGKEGFNRKIWNVTYIDEGESERLVLTLFSPDGEEGFPGDLDVTVTYRIENDALSVSYKAVCEKDSPLNLTNHAYFNLDGYNSDSILDHSLTLLCDKYSQVNDNLIPLCDVSVEGTPFDFRAEKKIGQDINSSDPQIAKCGGYDHNFVISSEKDYEYRGKYLARAAILKGKALEMTVYTDKPCMQIYTTNSQGKFITKSGKLQPKHSAICFETQFAPNGPNKGEGIIKAFSKYDYTTIFEFKKI